MSTGWVIVVAVVLALVVIRLCGWLTTRIAHDARQSCGVCGIKITEGWVIYELVSATGAPRPRGGGLSAYRCPKHRPSDAPAAPWHA